MSYEEDIELEDAISRIEAIQESVKKKVMSIGKDERSLALGIIASAFTMASESLQKYRSDLEASGEATAVPEEKKIRLRRLLNGVTKKVS